MITGAPFIIFPGSQRFAAILKLSLSFAERTGRRRCKYCIILVCKKVVLVMQVVQVMQVMQVGHERPILIIKRGCPSFVLRQPLLFSDLPTRFIFET